MAVPPLMGAVFGRAAELKVRQRRERGHHVGDRLLLLADHRLGIWLGRLFIGFHARLWRLFDDLGLALILFLRRGRLGFLRGLRRDLLLRLLLDGARASARPVRWAGPAFAPWSRGQSLAVELLLVLGARRVEGRLFVERELFLWRLGLRFFSGSGGSGGFCSGGGGCSACCSGGGGGSLTTSTEISSSGVGRGAPILSMKIRKATIGCGSAGRRRTKRESACA